MTWRAFDVVFVVLAGSLLFCIITFSARQCHQRQKRREAEAAEEEASAHQAAPHAHNVLMMSVPVPPYAEGSLRLARSHEDVVTLAITDDRFGPAARAELPAPIDLTQVVEVHDPYGHAHYYNDGLMAESVATMPSHASPNTSVPPPV